MERVFTLKKRFLFPALLFVFIAIIFTIGCTNHLLKPHQSDLSILVKLEKSSGRNITTGDYQITTWIENRDGTESHHQEINSTAGADASIIFEELAIGSEINIHLEVVETGTTGKKLVGTSDWITVNEGTNVVVIVLREDSDTVTAVTQTYNIGDEYRDDSGASIGYVFEVNDSYIKIVEKNEGWQNYWCGVPSNINNWSDLINISDGEEMYNAVKNQQTGDRSIFTYANNKNTSGESGWYIPTKEELFDIFKMNETHDVLNISGAYWSSSLESITGDYTAYYVQGTGESDSDLGTNYIDKDSNSVIAVKKIEL